MRRFYALAFVFVLLVLVAASGGGYVRSVEAGHVAVADRQSQQSQLDLNNSTVSKGNQTEGLDPVLAALQNSSSRQDFAAEHGLAMDGQSVLVVIELSSTQLPAGYTVQVQARSTGQEGQTLIQGYVPVSDLRALAQEPTVSHVRPPLEGVPDEQQQSTPAETPSSGEGGSSGEDGTSAGNDTNIEIDSLAGVALVVVLITILAAATLVYNKA